MEIQSNSLLYGHENEECICLVMSSTHGFVVKGLLNLKTCPKKRQGEFKRTETVLIGVHLEAER